MTYDQLEKIMRETGVQPNFFFSKEYWDKAEWQTSDDDVAFPVGVRSNEFFDYQYMYEPLSPDKVEGFLSGRIIRS